MKYNALLHGTPEAWDRNRKPHKGGGPSDTTTTQEIPAELKPLATAYADKAINLSQQNYNPYQGQRYADLNPVQNTGLGMTVERIQGR